MKVYNQKTFNRLCPICGYNSGKILRKIKMIKLHNISIDTEYEVVSCGNCGFCYADVVGNQSQYNLYYQKCNNYSVSTRLKEKIISQSCAIRYEMIEKYVEKEEKLLDIGCGDGTFLQYLKEKGYNNIYGIDPSKESIACLKEKNIQGQVGNIFEKVSPKLKNQFDIVVCTAVLEHIYDLKVALQQLDLYLAYPTGKIFIEVPAVEGFQKNIFPIANYFNQEHINYFSMVSLDNLFVENGYNRISRKEEAYKTITENGTKEELSLCAMYQKKEEKSKFVVDIISGESIKNYFQIVDGKDDNSYEKIKKILTLHDKIVIWGTGSYTLQLLREIPELEEHIAYFVDNNKLKQGKKIGNQMVYSPQQLLCEDECYFILICSMMNGKEIEEQINTMNLTNQYYIIES